MRVPKNSSYIVLVFLILLLLCVVTASAKNYGTFQLNKLPNAPSNPLCETQVNPAKIFSLTPTFSWTFSDDDAGDTQGGFNIIVGTSSGDDSLWSYTVSSGSSSVVYAGSALSRGTTYHWKIRTNDTYESTLGVFCGDQTFKINALPTVNLVSPSDTSIGVELSPTMGWSYSDADADAQTNYYIQISRYSAFNSTTLDRNVSGSDTSYTLTTPLTNATQYYWRVKVKDGNEWTDWTATWSFNTTNITVTGLITYNTGYQPTSSFSINQTAVIRYNVTNIQNMNNTYITIQDPNAVKRVDHQGVSSVQDAFTSDSNWNEDYPTRWNINSNRYQHGADGGSGQYGAYSLIKQSVLADQTNVTITVKVMIDFSNEDMQRILVRWDDANNYVAAYMSETYSVIGIEEKIGGVRYFEETSRLFQEDVWYTLKFVVEGDTARIYVDDLLLVTKTHLTKTDSGRIGLGTDTGWIYFDDYSVGYPNSRIVGSIPNGYQYEFNYTIPNNISDIGTWAITAYAESGGQTSNAMTTFDVFAEPPVIKNITTYNGTYVETNSFLNGENVIIRAWIADSDGRTAITECNITIKNSAGTTKVNEVDMTDVGDIDNGNIYEYSYTIPHEMASNGAWNVTIKAHDNESNSATDTDYFYDDVGAPNISSIKTYDESAVAQTLFSVGDTMKIRATITDANGRDNISHCNVTIIAPNGTTEITTAVMDDIGDVTNGNIYNYDYVLPTNTEAFGTWTILIQTCDVYYTVSQSSHFVLEWADVNYYHRTRISLIENFSSSRTNEPMGFKITLPSEVNGDGNSLKLVNEKGETMPFAVLKTSGTTYYINYVVNITADESVDYYLYYNVTGALPAMYETFAEASYDTRTLIQANYTQVYAPLTQNITYGKAVTIRDVDNDGQKEIIWVGRTGQGGSNKGFLAVYNATFSDNAIASLNQKAYAEWSYETGYGEAFAYSVNTSDVDNDGTIEIITGGTAYNGTQNVAQLRIWNYTGGVLNLETDSKWSDTTSGATSIFGVICSDVDNDGVKEILTAGTTGTNNARGQFTVHNYTAGVIKTEYFHNESLSASAGRNWTEHYAIAVGDVYNEGDAYPEIVVGGDAFDSGGTINAWFKIYRYDITNGWTLDRAKNWYDGDLSEIFSVAIGDCNNDGKNEIVTSGNYFDGARDVAMYRIWNCTGGGYPKTLNEETQGAKSWYTYGYSSALTVLINDIDHDEFNEIITVGFQNDNVVDRGDYKIRRYDGTTTYEEHSELWQHQFARRSGDFFDAATIADLNNDGFNELIDTGRYALTPPAGTYLRVQSVGGINQDLQVTADNHGDVLPPYPPVSGTVQIVAGNRTSSSIGYTWTKASDATTTVIIYKKGSYPTSVTDGTVGYNGTGSSTNFTGLDVGTKYYFSFFSWRAGSGEYSKDWRQSNDSTNPGPPTAFDAKEPLTHSIGLSWSKGTNATTTYIVRKTGSYPTNITDGSFVYNDTGTSTTDTGLDAVTTYFYRAWSYNVESDYFSLEYADDNELTLAEPPTVVTNASSNVEETTATLNGYIANDGGDDASTGFYYDTTTGGVTGNVSAVGIFSTGTEFSKGITSLTKGELYYYTAWASNNGGFSKAGNEEKLLTKPDAPTGLTGSASHNQINLNWGEASCGLGETVGTRVQYSISAYPTAIDDGSNAYNSTSESVQVGVSSDTTYYFSAWAWVKAETNDFFQWSDAYITFIITSEPSPPTDATANASLTSINISWNKEKTEYYTILVRNETGVAEYPSSITGGTLLYNGTLSYYNDEDLNILVTYYYSMWSYNSTTNLYSTAYATVSNHTQPTSMQISISPNATDFGLVPIYSEKSTTGQNYTLTNIGVECDISIQFNSSENWTASTFIQRGHNKFAMNWSSDEWENDININPITGTTLTQNLTYLQQFPFDLKVFTPTSSSTLDEQRWVMTFIVTVS